MASGPLDHTSATEESTALRAERDALARRCAAAERQVEELAGELAETRARLEQSEAALAAASGPLSIFEGGAPDGPGPLAGDGADPRVVSLVAAATAVVAGMVTLLALLNGNLFTWFGIAMVLLTIGLVVLAVRTRVVPVTVEVIRGMVTIERGESTYRFDLRSEATQVEQRGRVGDPDWQVRFLRRNMDPFVVDASMVDPERFLADLRRFRPSL